MSRLALCLVFLSALVLPFGAMQPAGAAELLRSAQQGEPSTSVDFAALALRPSDVGEPGWRHEGAFKEDLASEAAIVADYRSGEISAAEVEEQLTSFGWQDMYVNMLSRTDDGESSPSHRIRSYITAYASADGAEAGFTFLEDEGAASSAEDVPTTRPFGEQSELTADEGISGIDGRPFRSLDLTLRVDNLVAGVSLIIYSPEPGDDADLAAVEGLAAVLEARLLEPPADGGELGTAIARFVEGGPAAVTTYDDAYYRFDGNDVPLAGESEEAAELRIESYADATDVYQLWQGVDVGSADGVLYGVTSLAFPDEASATAWLDSLQSLLGENPFYGRLQPVEVTDTEHQTVALRYVSGGGSPDAPHAMLVAVRVGSVVTRVHLVPQGRLSDISLAEVQALAEIGVTCLTDQQCPDLTALPGTPGGAVATPDPSSE